MGSAMSAKQTVDDKVIYLDVWLSMIAFVDDSFGSSTTMNAELHLSTPSTRTDEAPCFKYKKPLRT